MTTKSDFDEFFAGVVQAALFTSLDAKDEPLDRNHTPNDVEPDDIADLRAHAQSFWLRMWFYVDAETNKQTAHDAGVDFWLTSQGHGTGFLDGDWPTYGEMLTKLAQGYPREICLNLKPKEEQGLKPPQDAEPKDLLERSIAHWERLSTGNTRPGETIGPTDCALCQKYLDDAGCVGCPVYTRTDMPFCNRTPYEFAAAAYDEYGAKSPEFFEAAKLELEFLKSLRPKKS